MKQRTFYRSVVVADSVELQVLAMLWLEFVLHCDPILLILCSLICFWFHQYIQKWRLGDCGTSRQVNDTATLQLQ